MSNRFRYHQMLISPHVGGGAKLAFEIHKHALATRGAVSHFFVPPNGEAERTIRSAGFAYTPYQANRLTSSGRMAGLTENLSLCANAARHGPGIIHIHAPFVYGAARPFLSLSRLRSVLHIHLDFTVEELRWALRTPPDLVILCADFMRDTLEQALDGVGTSRIRTVRNAVDTERFFPGDRAAEKMRLGEQPDVPLLMVVANLAPHKGQATAIKAVKELRDMGHRARLWIVGAERNDGTGHLQSMRELTADLEIEDSVHFAGFRTDVAGLLRAADFVLLPSTNEGLPLVLLEAQASGAVTLAAPTAGIPEIIDDEQTGFLVAADDHLGYARRVAELLGAEGRAQSIAAAAQRVVRDKHNIRHYCEQIFAAYDEVLPA